MNDVHALSSYLNQLEHDLSAMLTDFSETVLEYTLLKKIREFDYFIELIAHIDHFKNTRETLTLFHEHFILMHVLHQISARWYRENYAVIIFLSGSIRLEKIATIDTKIPSNTNANDKLRQYYLTLDNLFSESKGSIDAMLSDFWKNYHERCIIDKSNINDMFTRLGLQSTCSISELRKAYRRKIQQAHPDRGGSDAEFIALKKAYDTATQYLLQRS